MMRINCKGQAATEFVIAAVFVLVPLFLIVPLLGKYIDIRHAAVQQARYEAWEYTVWEGPNEKVKYGVKEDISAGKKTAEQARKEGKYIFFIDPFQENYGTSKQKVAMNPLWVDHHGGSLFYKDKQYGAGINESGSPDPTGGVANFVFGAFDWIYGVFGRALTFLGVKATFDAINNKAFYSSELQVKVRSIDQIIPLMNLDGVEKSPAKPLVFHARGSVQSDFWNSGSTDMASSQSKGLVFSAILSPVTSFLNKVINKIQGVVNFISKVLPISIHLPHFPDFGHVEDDLVPFEHLESVSKDGMGGKKLPTMHDDAGGLYYYKVEKDD